MSIQRRGNAIRVRVQHRGERHTRTFESGGDAAKYDAVIKVHLGRGRSLEEAVHLAGKAIAGRYSLDQAAGDWLADARMGIARTRRGTRLREATIADFEQHWRLHVTETFRSIEASALQTADIRTLLRTVSENPPPSAPSHVLHAVRLLVRHLITRGILDDDPATHIPTPTGGTSRAIALAPDEARRLLDAARKDRNPEAEAFIDLALATGARHGELQALVWGPGGLDLARRKVHITRSLRRATRSYGPTKSGLSRTVDLGRAVCQRMERFRQATSGRHGEVLFQTAHWQPVFERVRDAAGLRATGATIHTLRHTTTTWLLQAGFSPEEAAEVLGHRSGEFVVDTYAHAIAAYTEAAGASYEAFRNTAAPDELTADQTDDE